MTSQKEMLEVLDWIAMLGNSWPRLPRIDPEILNAIRALIEKEYQGGGNLPSWAKCYRFNRHPQVSRKCFSEIDREDWRKALGIKERDWR
jgi:hypothetical protein